MRNNRQNPLDPARGGLPFVAGQAFEPQTQRRTMLAAVALSLLASANTTQFDIDPADPNTSYTLQWRGRTHATCTIGGRQIYSHWERWSNWAPVPFDRTTYVNDANPRYTTSLVIDNKKIKTWTQPGFIKKVHHRQFRIIATDATGKSVTLGPDGYLERDPNAP